jgi:hypothetical protein
MMSAFGGRTDMLLIPAQIPGFDILAAPGWRPGATLSQVDRLRKLAAADIPVVSRSSFSYFGGVLNGNGIILLALR